MRPHLVPRSDPGTAPASFQVLLPSIRRIVSYASRRLKRDQRQEFIAAAVARAYEMYVRLVARGKAALAYSTALANFAVRQVRSGRSTGSQQNVRDVFSSMAQRRKGFSVVSLSNELLSDPRKADPGELAALRIDFAAWLLRLSRFKRRVALFLAFGNSTNETAERFGISAARVSQIRRELRLAWEAFQATPAAA